MVPESTFTNRRLSLRVLFICNFDTLTESIVDNWSVLIYSWYRMLIMILPFSLTAIFVHFFTCSTFLHELAQKALTDNYGSTFTPVLSDREDS